MFICSVRASGVKFFATLILTLATLLAITLGAGAVSVSAPGSSSANFSDIKSEEDRISFLESHGVKVKGNAIEEVPFVMPENFDRVMLGYNEIQKAQGLDLSKYSRKKVTRYTYEVESSEEEGIVYANLLIYRNRIIGCDISSADPNGFVKPIVK